METKTVYRYDLQGFYAGPLVLDDSDRGPVTKEWQIPRNCALFAPEGLVPDEHHLIHWNKGDGAWELVENPNNPVPPPEPKPEPEPPYHEPTLEERVSATEDAIMEIMDIVGGDA